MLSQLSKKFKENLIIWWNLVKKLLKGVTRKFLQKF